MDYRKILLAYINWIGENEGINFLDSGHRPERPWDMTPELTAEEFAALIIAGDESESHYKKRTRPRGPFEHVD